MLIKFGLLSAVPLFVLFTLAVPFSGVNRSSIATTANRLSLDWFKLCPNDEEFSVLLPTKPTVTVEPSAYVYVKGGERVLGHKAFSGYVEDFAFVIESYLASHPERLFSQMRESFKELPLINEEKDEKGIMRRRYLWQALSSVGQLKVFTTARHVYVVTAVSRSNDTNLTRFMSSFSLDLCERVPVDISLNSGSIRYMPATNDSYGIKEVDQKPLIVFRPKARYPSEARQWQKTGVVVLASILRSDGKVVVLEVVKDPKYGFTDEAISAANNLVFLPAKKDGRSVSVRMTLEYRFNLY